MSNHLQDAVPRLLAVAKNIRDCHVSSLYIYRIKKHKIPFLSANFFAFIWHLLYNPGMIIALIFIFGLAVGSFLNVCIHRLPRDESVVWPSSRCPNCGAKLRLWELVPLLSFIWLRGRCASCGAPISWRYPLVELTTGFLFVFCYFQLSTFSSLLSGLLLSSLLIVVFFIDLEHQVIPDSLNVIGLFGGLFFNVWSGTLLPAIFGAALGFSLLLLIAQFGRFLFKQEAMGEGDRYLAAMLGAWLGWQVILAIFLAYLIAGLLVILLLLFRRVKIGDSVPFGPYLAAGGLITFFFSSQIVSWYLNLIK
jgi:leader peptidase (prepilin peptidase)/N-methyltransferase